MKKYSFFLFFLVSIYSCNNQSKSSKYKQQFTVTLIFLNKLSLSDVDGVKKMIGVSLSDISKNEEILSFEVDQLSKILNSHKLPDKSTYRLTEYQSTDSRLLNIRIPMEDDTLEIAFAKFLPADKIWWYNWNKAVNNNLSTIPPDSLKY